jgi:hypothetical protein
MGLPLQGGVRVPVAPCKTLIIVKARAGPDRHFARERG